MIQPTSSKPLLSTSELKAQPLPPAPASNAAPQGGSLPADAATFTGAPTEGSVDDAIMSYGDFASNGTGSTTNTGGGTHTPPPAPGPRPRPRPSAMA